MGCSMNATAADDWRTQLQSEARQRIVNNIMETLKRHLPISVPEGLNELNKIAVRFEEKIYSAATSQSDYLRKISVKMLSMERQSQQIAPINPAMPNADVVDQNSADPGFPVNNQVVVPCLNSPNKRPRIPGNGSIINCESCSMSGYDLSSKIRNSSESLPENGSVDENTSVCQKCNADGEKREDTFNCPICMSAMASPFSTICGHIFCEVCIKDALEKRKECPICREKLTEKNDIHRIYLSYSRVK